MCLDSVAPESNISVVFFLSLPRQLLLSRRGNSLQSVGEISKDLDFIDALLYNESLENSKLSQSDLVTVFCGQIRCCRGLMLWVAFVKVLRKRRFAYDKVVASLEITLVTCFGEGEALF